MSYCLNVYAPGVPLGPVCELPAGHAGPHETVDADGDTWSWDNTPVHHPSCPRRHDAYAACLCGPEAAAEDAVILAERSPDAMVLDVIAHAVVGVSDFADRCRRGPVSGLMPRVYRRNLRRHFA